MAFGSSGKETPKIVAALSRCFLPSLPYAHLLPMAADRGLSRSLFYRASQYHPTSIVDNLAIASHIGKHTKRAILQYEAANPATTTPRSQHEPQKGLQRILPVREPFQRITLNHGSLAFPNRATAELCLPRSYGGKGPESFRVPLPVIEEDPSRQRQSPTSPSSSSSSSVSVYRDTLKETSRVFQGGKKERAPQTEREFYFAGLRDVAPLIGLHLPASMLSEDKSDNRERTAQPSVPQVPPEQWTGQWFEIKLKKKERGLVAREHPAVSAASKTRSGQEMIQRRKEAFRQWSEANPS